jgi:glycosyltransferase involved in cell wall biosynthesis
MGDGCGAESFYRAVHAYVEHGHRVRVLMPVIGPRAVPAKTDGVSIDSVPFTFDPMRDPAAGARGFASWMIRYARFQRVMTRAGIESARAFRPDIVVGMGAYAAPVARRVATAARVPNVTRLFGQSLGRHLDANGRVLDSVRFRTNVPELRAFRTPCSALVVHDDGARGDVVARRLGVADERFYYWRDGVSVTGVSNADPNVRRALGVPEQAVVAAYVGRLSAEKNLFAILEAFAYAAGEQADLHFVFVGDGPLRSDLEAAAARSHYPDRVHCAGAFPHELMSHMLPGIDILVSLSDRTNMTNATLEAMAAGLAVIALDAGDTATVVRDGDTGVLIARESELAPALLRLARARELRRELGNRARALIAGTFESVEARLAREVDLVARIARRGRVHSAAER